MSDRDIAAAAMRWHAARGRRLNLGRRMRQLQNEATCTVLTSPALRELEWQHAEAKRAERLALCTLTKACQKAADSQVVDA